MPASWGKVSQGQPFAIVATDFGRAIMAAGLGIHESSLLWFVIERSWGESKKAGGRSKWPEPTPVKLDIRRLAEETGFVRQRMYEARSRLMAKNILIEQPEGVLINKNAETWIDPKTSKPLIPKEAIRYAKSSRPSPANLNAPAFNSERSSVQPRTLQRSNLNAPAFNSERSSVQPLIEERAAEDLRRFKRPPASGLAADAPASPPASQGGIFGAPEECREAARKCWGDAQAEAIGHDPDGMARAIRGRFDSLLAAILKLHAEGREIADVRRLAITVANRMTLEGTAAPPVRAGKPPALSMAERKDAARKAMAEALARRGET
jgi:hypothetical protein